MSDSELEIVNIPLLTKAPKHILEAVNNCYHRDDNINGYMIIEIIEEKDKDIYNEEWWIVSKYLKEKGFAGKEIMIDCLH